MMNVSFRDDWVILLICSFVNVMFYCDCQEFVLNILVCVFNIFFVISFIFFNSVVLFVMWKIRVLYILLNILFSGLVVIDLVVGCVFQLLYIVMKLLEIYQYLVLYCFFRIVNEILIMVVLGILFLIFIFIVVECYLVLYLYFRYKVFIMCQWMVFCLVILWLFLVIGVFFRFLLSF